MMSELDANPWAGADLELRDVWRKNDAQTTADVTALWSRDAALAPETDPVARAKTLCVAAYAAGEVVGVSTVEVEWMAQVRAHMAFLRVYVARAHRARKLIHPISAATYDAVERFALARPELRIGGLAAQVRSKPGIYKPVSEIGMVLIGYDAEDTPLIVRWFEHYRL
jgi:hypothetical protein